MAMIHYEQHDMLLVHEYFRNSENVLQMNREQQQLQAEEVIWKKYCIRKLGTGCSMPAAQQVKLQ